MTSPKPDWHLVMAILSVLIAFVVAIPTVYSFEKQRFFWQVDPRQQDVTQSRKIRY